MPPGLPSSVSTNIQKSFSPAPCLSSGIHSKRPQMFMSCALFLHSVRHPKPLFGKQYNSSDTGLPGLTAVHLQQQSQKGTKGKSHLFTKSFICNMYLQCFISGAFALWSHFFPSAKSSHQIPEEDSYKSLKLFTPPHFFLSVSLSGHHISLFFPHPTPFHSASLSIPLHHHKQQPSLFSRSLPHRSIPAASGVGRRPEFGRWFSNQECISLLPLFPLLFPV